MGYTKIKPHFYLILNKGKIGEEVLKLPIRNINGKEIIPDFYNLYSKKQLPMIGYSPSYDKNKDLYMLLPENLTKYDVFNNNIANSYIPKITRHILNMKISISNTKREKMIVFHDRHKEKDNQNTQTILFSNNNLHYFYIEKKMKTNMNLKMHYLSLSLETTEQKIHHIPKCLIYQLKIIMKK